MESTVFMYMLMSVNRRLENPFRVLSLGLFAG